MTPGVHDPRLVLARRPTHRDHLHGAWWPSSTDLDRELGAMLVTAKSRFGVVLGIKLNREEWSGASLTDRVARSGTVKISWYGLTEPHLAVLYCANARRIALLVLPPQTPEPAAVTATLMASRSGNTLGTVEVLAAAAERSGA